MSRARVLGLVLGVLALIGYGVWVSLGSSVQEYEGRNDLLAAADLNEGREIAKACTICHSVERGEPHRIGPNLFGIYGAKIAVQPGFNYSYAIQQRSHLRWTVDHLDQWIRDPAEFIPENKMIFHGLADPQDRMDLIAYLMSLKK